MSEAAAWYLETSVFSHKFQIKLWFIVPTDILFWPFLSKYSCKIHSLADF